MPPKLLLSIAMLSLSLSALSQDTATTLDKITRFPTRFLQSVDKKTAYLEEKLDRQTEKYLEKLAKKEARLKKQISKVDPDAAGRLFAMDPEQSYRLLLDRLHVKPGSKAAAFSGSYMPYLDSLKGSLSFLDQNPALISSSKVLPANIQQSLGQLQALQSKMQHADQIKQFLEQRKAQLKRYISQNTQLGRKVRNAYTDYSKQVIYYNQQLKEYKEMLNDPDKMFNTALKLLNKLPAFTRFMQKNGMLAGLFNTPGNEPYATGAQAVNGLQPRTQVIAALQSQSMQPGPNATALVQRNLTAAQEHTGGPLNSLMDRFAPPKVKKDDLDLPSFKPNTQKSKPFMQRLEYSTNLQSAKSSSFFPITTDLALSVGYKLNDKSIIGIGASYKVGWGKEIRHINITSEGMGLRSFLDVKMKGSFYASGGFEYNYQQPIVPDASYTGAQAWQQSGLIGVSKIISLKTKVFKKTKVQLLWDFLSYRQVPATPALKFRVGYSF